MYTGEDKQGLVYGICAFIVDYNMGGNETVCFLFNDKMKQNLRDVIASYRPLLELRTTKRLQAFVRADWTDALRFAKRLGFEVEGLLKSFGANGEDYYAVRYCREF